MIGVRREGRVVELSLKPVKSDRTFSQLVSQLNERIKHQFDVWIFRTYQYSSWLVWGEKTTGLVSKVLQLQKVFFIYYLIISHV